MFNYTKQDNTLSSIWTVSASSSCHLSLIKNIWAYHVEGWSVLSQTTCYHNCLLSSWASSQRLTFTRWPATVLICGLVQSISGGRVMRRSRVEQRCFSNTDVHTTDRWIRQIEKMDVDGLLYCRIKKTSCWQRWKQIGKDGHNTKHVTAPPKIILHSSCSRSAKDGEKMWVMKSIMNSLNDTTSCQIA